MYTVHHTFYNDKIDMLVHKLILPANNDPVINLLFVRKLNHFDKCLCE